MQISFSYSCFCSQGNSNSANGLDTGSRCGLHCSSLKNSYAEMLLNPQRNSICCLLFPFNIFTLMPSVQTKYRYCQIIGHTGRLGGEGWFISCTWDRKLMSNVNTEIYLAHLFLLDLQTLHTVTNISK